MSRRNARLAGLALLASCGEPRAEHPPRPAPPPAAAPATAPEPAPPEPPPAPPPSIDASPPPRPLPPPGPAILELGSLAIDHYVDGEITPSLRLHPDGRIESFQTEWRPGRISIRADGVVVCARGVGGTIGGKDGRPHPAAPELAAEWGETGSWRIVRRSGRWTLHQADGSRVTLRGDGELVHEFRDEDTGKLGPPERYGRVEGATTPGLTATAMWILGLYAGDEQPICWE